MCLIIKVTFWKKLGDGFSFVRYQIKIIAFHSPSSLSESTFSSSRGRRGTGWSQICGTGFIAAGIWYIQFLPSTLTVQKYHHDGLWWFVGYFNIMETAKGKYFSLITEGIHFPVRNFKYVSYKYRLQAIKYRLPSQKTKINWIKPKGI